MTPKVQHKQQPAVEQLNRSYDEPDLVQDSKQSFASKAKTQASKFFSYSKATKTVTQQEQEQMKKQQSWQGYQAQSVKAAPVKLEEPPPPPQHQNHASSSLHQSRYQSHVDGTSKLSFDSNEADQFIEQLMREAETDPKLRELTYGSSKVPKDEPKKPPIGGMPVLPTSSQKPPLNESYPMVQRPYRTQQDMIIKERDDSPTQRQARPLERHKMDKRPYRTNEDMKIVDMDERSKSADGRLNQSFPGFKKKDPKLSHFSTSSENVNVTGNLMNEVVTDQDHTSVRDLVAMIEKNTRSESVNPYVRRWGCDLISPEPHKREKTFRRERKEMPKQLIWKQARNGKLNQSLDSYAGGDTSYDDHDLSAHITDMDNLLGRKQHEYSGEFMNQTGSSIMSKFDGTLDDDGPQRTETPVIWPPPSPTPQDVHDSRTPVIHRASPIPPSPPPPPPAMLLTQDIMAGGNKQYKQPKEPLIGRSLSTENRGSARTSTDSFSRFNSNSLTEIDKQISTIQNEFEAELDGLIDAYRKMQSSQKKGTTSATEGWCS